MDFNPRTRVAVVTGPGPQITGTVTDNDQDGHLVVRLDSGEMVRGCPGDFYELVDDLGRVVVESEPVVRRPAVGLRQFAEDLDPTFAGFYTWGPAFLADADGGDR